MTAYQIFGNRRGVLTAYETCSTVFQAMDAVDKLYVSEVYWHEGKPPRGLEWSRIEDNGLLTNGFTAFDGTCTTQWFIVEVEVSTDTIWKQSELKMSSRLAGEDALSSIVPGSIIRAGSARKKKEVSND